MTPDLEIQIIAVIVAVASVLPGVFLVLRKMSMMSDAITHTILLGIVLGFFIIHNLNSPILILGASLMGLLTVYLVELLDKTKLVSKDSAIGIVFPMLFSIAIIIISKYAANVHIDVDSVLLGELAFAPFTRMIVFGVDIGPASMYTMLGVLIINLLFVVLFYKELKITIFDASLAAALGISPVVFEYALMSVVSITTVSAFEVVGSILVIAFMIGPPVSAYLITDKLKNMIIISAVIGAINALIGYRVALFYDVSIAGSMATITGVTFLLVFIFAPKRGLITVFRRRKNQKIEFEKKSLLFHILNHEKTDRKHIENGIESIHTHMNWDKLHMKKILSSLKKDHIIELVDNNYYILTDEGRKYTKQSYEEIIESFKEETLV